MTKSEDWPFDQATDVAAITDASVVNGAPILLVVHYASAMLGSDERILTCDRRTMNGRSRPC